MRFSAAWAAGRIETLAGAGAVTTVEAPGGALAGAGPTPATLADWKIVMAADSRPPPPPGAVTFDSTRGSRPSGRMVPETSARRGAGAMVVSADAGAAAGRSAGR